MQVETVRTQQQADRVAQLFIEGRISSGVPESEIYMQDRPHTVTVIVGHTAALRVSYAETTACS